MIQPRHIGDRLAAAALILLATVLIALVESFYVPLRVGTIRIPLSLGLAVVCHPVLIWLMRAGTGSILAMLATFGVWLAVILRLGLPRADGDLIITGNNWVSTALMFGGSLIFVGSIGLSLPRRPHPGQMLPAGSLGGNGSA